MIFSSTTSSDNIHIYLLFCRAYVAQTTSQSDRTTYMARITAVQYAGFTVTPFVGALLCKVFGDTEYTHG